MNKNKSLLLFVSLFFSGICFGTIDEDFEQLYKTLVRGWIPSELPSGRNSQGATILHVAAAAGNANAVHDFFSHVADINAKDQHNFTPLGTALRHARVVWARSGLGLSEIQTVKRRYLAVIDLLLRNGADITEAELAILRRQFPTYDVERAQGERELLDEDDELGPRVKRRRLSETALG